MQFFAVVAAALFATAQAACSLTDLQAISGSGASKTCLEKTGYEIKSFGPPTAAQYPKVCVEPSCQQLLDSVLKTAPKPCSIATIDIYALIIDPILKECPKYQNPTTPAPGPGTPTVTPKTPEPSAC